MRAFAHLALAIAVAAASGLSCTLLVQFHDQPEGGLEGGDDATSPPREAGRDAPEPPDGGKPTKDSGREPIEAGEDHYAPCTKASGAPLASGYYCGDDGLNGYAGNPGDLVYCVDGGVAKVTNCDGGCVDISDPFPDACNPCVGIANGAYCGRNLPGFPSTNADFLIDCTGGQVGDQDACAHGCDSNGKISSCFPG